MVKTTEEILSAAWKSLGGNPNIDGFPRGFWPDVARVAVEMAIQDTFEPELDFRPTMAGHTTMYMKREERKTRFNVPMQRIIEETKADNPFEQF